MPALPLPQANPLSYPIIALNGDCRRSDYDNSQESFHLISPAYCYNYQTQSVLGWAAKQALTGTFKHLTCQLI